VEPALDSSGPPEPKISHTLNPVHQPRVKKELAAKDKEWSANENVEGSLSNNGVSSLPPSDDDYSPPYLLLRKMMTPMLVTMITRVRRERGAKAKQDPQS